MRFRPPLSEGEEDVSLGCNQVTDLENGDLGCKAGQNPEKPIHIHSRILDANLWIVPDGWTGKLDGPVYSDTEVRELNQLQPTPEELRAIHRAKIGINGDVVPSDGTGPCSGTSGSINKEAS